MIVLCVIVNKHFKKNFMNLFIYYILLHITFNTDPVVIKDFIIQKCSILLTKSFFIYYE